MTTIQAAQAIAETREHFTETMNAPRLLATLRRLCKESDQSYEPPLNRAEDCACLATMRHFIDECERAGTDPAQVLKDVVTHWRTIRAGVLKTTDGRDIILPPAVDWFSVYRWRRQIIHWLEVHHA